MKGRLFQRLRQLSISNSLRGAFLIGALLTLIVSMVSLYSWHEQSSQVRYSLDEYFPRIHSAFLIEGNLNLAVDQLNEFLLAPNTTVRLQLRTQIIQHLDKIERLSQGFSLLNVGNWPSFYKIAGPCWRSWTTPSTTCFWCGRKSVSFPLALTGSMMISPQS